MNDYSCIRLRGHSITMAYCLGIINLLMSKKLYFSIKEEAVPETNQNNCDQCLEQH